ncbi:MAG: hypothetical protein EB084_03830 [Proteobacteria bacterium]|nr:hypothetical protein [Pseudomonadota bacterium]
MAGPPPPIIIKKIIKGGHGHHGGSWKVAYADFVTSMLALFIVLWIIGQSKQTRQAIAEYFKDPSKTPAEIVALLQDERSKERKAVKDPSLPPAAAQDVKRLDDLQKKLEQKLKNMKTDEGKRVSVEVQWTDDGLRVTLLDHDKVAFFDVGNASPKPHTCRVLRAIGRELGAVPNPVVIEGHTDRRKFSTNGDYGNWELSTERGNAARRLLLSGGLQPNRIHEVRGYADTRLLHPTDPFDSENRRVSILVRFLAKSEEEKAELSKRLGGKSKPDTSKLPGAPPGSAPSKASAAKEGHDGKKEGGETKPEGHEAKNRGPRGQEGGSRGQARGPRGQEGGSRGQARGPRGQEGGSRGRQRGSRGQERERRSPQVAHDAPARPGLVCTAGPL